jgi:beta-phosphoglucomutase-like phosphatase (HAD superfamily)
VYEDGDPGIEAARRAGLECIDIRKMQTAGESNTTPDMPQQDG